MNQPPADPAGPNPVLPPPFVPLVPPAASAAPMFAPPVAPVSAVAPIAPFGPAAPGAWAPPPKPGLIPLRPLSLGVILSASFVLLRKSPGATLVPALLLSLASAAIGAALAAIPVDGNNPDELARALREGAPWMIGVFISVVIDGVAAIAVTRGALGERMGLRAVIRRARGRDKVLVMWAFLIAALVGVVIVAIRLIQAALNTSGVGVSSMLFGVLGTLLGFPILGAIALWIGTKLAFVPAALLIEHARLGAAIRRSWRLTKRSFWRIAGTRLLVWIMLVVASAVIAFPFNMLLGIGSGLIFPNGGDLETYQVFDTVSAVVVTIIPALTAAIGAVVGGATVGLLYVDTRMRREGLDLELTRYAEAPDPAVDPFLPKAA